jgi:hypothetical protein
MSSPWTTASTRRVPMSAGGAAFALHAASVLQVEVEPCPRHVDDEAEPGRPRCVDYVGDHIVHGPSVAQ